MEWLGSFNLTIIVWGSIGDRIIERALDLKPDLT